MKDLKEWLSAFAITGFIIGGCVLYSMHKELKAVEACRKNWPGTTAVFSVDKYYCTSDLRAVP